MSNYTEFVLKLRLNGTDNRFFDSIWDFVIAGNGWVESPDIDLNEVRRAFKVNSFYHIPETIRYYDGDRIFVRCDTQQPELILEFLHYCRSSITDGENTCLGYMWSEDSPSPYLLWTDDLENLISALDEAFCAGKIKGIIQASQMSAEELTKLSKEINED